jgi:conjugal transfer pilus assembly protein TraD
VLGNINNLILLRVLDAETQQYVTDSLPKTRPEKPAAYPGQHHTLPEPTALHWQCRRAPGRGEGDLFPPALLGQLPDLHYLAVLAGGRIVKGRLPILGTPKEAA